MWTFRHIEGLILSNIYNGKKVRHKSPEETKQAVQGIGLNKEKVTVNECNEVEVGIMEWAKGVPF